MIEHWNHNEVAAESDDAAVVIRLALTRLHEVAGPDSVACFFSTAGDADLAVPSPEAATALKRVLEGRDCLRGPDGPRAFPIAADQSAALAGQWVQVLPVRARGWFCGTLALAGDASPSTTFGEILGESARFIVAGLQWAALVNEERDSAPRDAPRPDPEAANGLHALIGRWRDLDDLAVRSSQVLGSPLAVLSPTYEPIVSAGLDTAALGALVRGEAARAALHQAGRSRTTVRFMDGQTPHLAAVVQQSGDILGYVVTVVPDDADEECRGSWDEVRRILAVELLVRDRIRQEVDADEREIFLDLVEGKALGRIEARAQRLGFDLTRPHTAVALRVPKTSILPPPDRALRQLQGLLLESYAGSVPANAPRPLTGRVGDRELLAFLPLSDGGVVEKVGWRTAQRAACLGLPAAVGIGPLCESPPAFSESAARARWTAEVLGLAGMGRGVASFGELGVYALLFKPYQTEELDRFVNQWIGVLIEHDERHKSDLTTTLGALLEGRGLRDAAERLLIHVSTLKYRIKRINEILALDYHDPEIAFNLQLAVRLLKIGQGSAERPAPDPEQQLAGT